MQGAARSWAASDDGALLALAAGMTTARVYAVLAGKSTLDNSSPLWAGVMCEAYDEGEKLWLRATVYEANADGTYTVDWGQDQYSYHMARRHLRATGLQTTGSDFSTLRHAMTLSGRQPVTCVGIRGDGLMAATCSEDGAVRLWDLDVRWPQKEDPKLIVSWADDDYVRFTNCAVAPNGKLVVLATGDGALLFYMIEKGQAKLYGEVSGAHPSGGNLSALFFGAKNLLLSCSENDGKCRLWNLPGCIPKLSMKPQYE